MRPIVCIERVKNIEIMIGSETDDIIYELYESLLQKYQEGLEESMRGSKFIFDFFFFSIWVFFHEHSRITGLQGKGEGFSLTPQYHFHPLYRHLDISQVITAESSPLYIASSRTRTWNLWFRSASG